MSVLILPPILVAILLIHEYKASGWEGMLTIVLSLTLASLLFLLFIDPHTALIGLTAFFFFVIKLAYL